MPVTSLPPEVRDRLDGVLDRLACTAGRPRRVEPLDGGLTNVNVKVTTDERVMVVRLSDTDAGPLAIDRVAEHTNSVRAARAGAAPRVVDYLPGEGVLVVAWVEGRTWAPADLREEANLMRAAAACRRLHAGPRFDGDFDMVAVQRRYLDIVRREGYRLPADYLDLLPQVDAVAAALRLGALATVPCHNDLLAANLVDDGERVWIIDYEYAGNNDPCFELGNLWSESTLDPEHLTVLVEAYFGEHRPDQVARARLYGLLSQYGWTLWASIQDAVSPLDFDFWSWGMEKYERAVTTLADPTLPRLLDRAAGPG